MVLRKISFAILDPLDFRGSISLRKRGPYSICAQLADFNREQGAGLNEWPDQTESNTDIGITSRGQVLEGIFSGKY